MHYLDPNIASNLTHSVYLKILKQMKVLLINTVSTLQKLNT